MRTKSKIFLLFPALLGALLLFESASHARSIWTYVGSACVPDEGSINKYQASAGKFEHKGSNTGSIFGRCNVANPVDIAGVVAYPDWNTLEVVYRDPDSDPTNTNTNQVIVKLIRVSNTTGGVSTLATFDSENSGASSSFQTNSTTFSHNFNFTIYAYYVEIQVKRNNSGASNNPAVSIVRLIEGIE